MAITRASRTPTILRSCFSRTARSRTGGQARQLGRRTYASEGHGGQKKSSGDLPWLIGSVVFTVPSAAWLWQQGPKKTAHHDHGHDEKHGEGEDEVTEEGEPEAKEESDEDKETESKEKSEDDAPSDKDDAESDSPKDDAEPSAEDSEDSGSDGTGTPKSDADSDESEESDKGSKSDKESKSDKGGKSDEGGKSGKGDKSDKAKEPVSGSLHPYMADDEKSRKGEGIVETAKIHGTVDSGRKLG